MVEDRNSCDGVPNLVEQPAELEEMNGSTTNPLVYKSRGFGSAAMSGIAFLGSVFVLLGILFSPEIALALALSFAQKH